ELGIPEEKFKIDILSGTSIRVNYQQKNNMESDHSISKRPTETNSNNIEGSGSNAQNGARLELRKMSYVNRSVKISYPEIINLDDSEKEKRLNELLKHDALEAAKYFGGNEQGTEININYVPMLVGSNFISIQYVGSNYVKDGAYPNNIFSQLILM
ncbi:MAG: hypothetical protein LBJ26_23195, partial [Paenibacillus sp.]|nr:hypothetical protein [Paenibacillus sp.]